MSIVRTDKLNQIDLKTMYDHLANSLPQFSHEYYFDNVFSMKHQIKISHANDKLVTVIKLKDDFITISTEASQKKASNFFLDLIFAGAPEALKSEEIDTNEKAIVKGINGYLASIH